MHTADDVSREGVSLAREVQTVRVQAALQPGQKGTKNCLTNPAISSSACATATTNPSSGGLKRSN
jgi:hypothetical protein